MAAADPVTFTVRGAQRIERAVRKVERPGQILTGDRRPTAPSETTFWALLTGNDITGMRYSFVRVIPVATKDESDFVIGRDFPLYYEIASLEPEEGFAREANGTRGIPLYSVVQVTYIGPDADDLPAFLFNYQVMDSNLPITPHDHRDNFNGGFAFACYHPGTGLPQQPWAV